MGRDNGYPTAAALARPELEENGGWEKDLSMFANPEELKDSIDMKQD